MSESTESVKVGLGELAGALGVCERTVLRWVGRGWIPAIVLPSGHRRFDAAAVAAALRARGATVTRELAALAGEAEGAA